MMWPVQALAVDDMSNIKEMVDDYMERNQEDFEDFVSPDDVYEEILHHLDSLEVPASFALTATQPCIQCSVTTCTQTYWHHPGCNHGSAVLCFKGDLDGMRCT